MSTTNPNTPIPVYIAASTTSADTPIPVAITNRETLTANRTYYVRTDGSDSNTGLADSAASAFLTFQKAVDVTQALDLNGYTVTIQAGGTSGTFTGQILVNGPFVGAKSTDAVKLKGDTTTPSNFVLQTTANSSSGVVFAYQGGRVAIEGFKLTASGSSSDLLRADYGSHIVVTGKMEYGSATASQIVAARNSTIQILASYTISGGAAQHWNANSYGFIACQGFTITISGTPAFSTAFANINGGNLTATANTYSGSATGKLYDIQRNGVAQTIGATLPGDVAGTTATGGQFT